MNCIPRCHDKAEEITKQVAAWVLLYLWALGIDFDYLVVLNVMGK